MGSALMPVTVPWAASIARCMPPIHAVYCHVQVYKTPSTLHSASVNGIAFGPQELGLVLACASSDGSVSVVEHQQDGTWTSSKVKGFWQRPQQTG